MMWMDSWFLHIIAGLTARFSKPSHCASLITSIYNNYETLTLHHHHQLALPDMVIYINLTCTKKKDLQNKTKP